MKASGRKSIVQCKRYNGSVGSSTVCDFYGVLIDSLADEGYIVTPGTFTLPDKNWVQGKPLNLIYEAELIKILQAQIKAKESRKNISN